MVKLSPAVGSSSPTLMLRTMATPFRRWGQGNSGCGYIDYRRLLRWPPGGIGSEEQGTRSREVGDALSCFLFVSAGRQTPCTTGTFPLLWGRLTTRRKGADHGLRANRREEDEPRDRPPDRQRARRASGGGER